ncbi:MAG: leucyl/phenylalanyl-tRNA--protein transferase [SAR324 cluster bacterium]|uniref:Leucyl/phenylalanyl-tRNA--protein transferase n=1 Tax=SAR324 cluster bacterium TaxID=2024889 RepID=A0A7X9FPT5_9DELT|nr:leucyl/phenylalanyl-tRNA--protein transferase [SAR324 cluster bacterium]
MAISKFPSVDLADESGLLAVGGDLEVESLLLAYRNGIFPWPFSDEFPAWFSPPKRAVLFFKDFHIPKSLKKKLRKGNYTIYVNRDTPSVIRACANAKNRKGQRGTWITKDMIEAYIRLHMAGYCHSVECYQETRLIGGYYGVCINQFCGGESMFHIETDASKLCLFHLVEILKAKGVTWLDVQMLTPLLEHFGAREIPRTDFLSLLEDSLSKDPITIP